MSVVCVLYSTYFTVHCTLYICHARCGIAQASYPQILAIGGFFTFLFPTYYSMQFQFYISSVVFQQMSPLVLNISLKFTMNILQMDLWEIASEFTYIYCLTQIQAYYGRLKLSLKVGLDLMPHMMGLRMASYRLRWIHHTV